MSDISFGTCCKTLAFTLNIPTKHFCTTEKELENNTNT